MTWSDTPGEQTAPAAVPQPAAPSKGSGLAITALVLGVVSLLLCWVPIINNAVFVLALIGLAFGLPALLGARKRRRAGGGMALAGVVLLVLSLVGVLASQAFYGKVLDDVSDSVGQATEDAAAGRGVASEDEVPVAALEGGKVLIQETFNLGTDERSYWPVP